MARLTLKERFEFDVLETMEDRLAFSLVHHLANDGHGDVGSCGVAEFNLLEFSAALEWPPGETLRRLNRISGLVKGLCVEKENVVLFALAGAEQNSFDHLYKSRGFEGLPPNLPKVAPRYARV
ncbi:MULTISPECIES: hypothetical protein [Agrobacterium tumefaciens complex]|uniref:hypothetical protein n=1 Tax=Agrobacterium tumefaciens TaxID=358 RepID=UPI000FE3977F|nr:hypothetical protein [Agrobacterium tumefaciens]